MANKKISDLTLATSILDTDMFERATALATSGRVTALQFKNYVVPGELSLQDDAAVEFFDGYSVGAIASFTQGLGWANNGVSVGGASIIATAGADGRAQQRLALNNGSYGRRMPWGDKWNRIKVVLMLRIDNAANFANTNGYIGVCSGTAAMVDSAVCANFVGTRWGDGTGTSTFTAGTKISFFDTPTFRAVSRRVNTTTDRGGLGSGHTISADAGYISMVIQEISRPVFANDAASVNYSVGEAETNQTTVQFSKTKNIASRIAFGDITSTLAASGSDSVMGANGVTAVPFAFDQSTGALDTINLYWPQAFNLEIAALCVRKIN
jgi:hypothetical protein